MRLTRVVPEIYSRDEIFACYPESLRRVPRIRAVVDWLVRVWADDADALAGQPPS